MTLSTTSFQVFLSLSLCLAATTLKVVHAWAMCHAFSDERAKQLQYGHPLIQWVVDCGSDPNHTPQLVSKPVIRQISHKMHTKLDKNQRINSITAFGYTQKCKTWRQLWLLKHGPKKCSIESTLLFNHGNYLLGKMPFILFQIRTARSWQCRGTFSSSSRGKLDTSTLRYGSKSTDDFASKASISIIQWPGFDDSSSNATAATQ